VAFLDKIPHLEIQDKSLDSGKKISNAPLSMSIHQLIQRMHNQPQSNLFFTEYVYSSDTWICEVVVGSHVRLRSFYFIRYSLAVGTRLGQVTKRAQK
jgi:hypothetical protein